MEYGVMIFLCRSMETDAKIFQFIEILFHNLEKRHGINLASYAASLFSLCMVAWDVAFFFLNMKIGIPAYACLIAYPVVVSIFSYLYIFSLSSGINS